MYNNLITIIHKLNFIQLFTKLRLGNNIYEWTTRESIRLNNLVTTGLHKQLLCPSVIRSEPNMVDSPNQMCRFTNTTQCCGDNTVFTAINHIVLAIMFPRQLGYRYITTAKV